MNLLFWALTLGVAGKILLGVTVMRVHWRIIKEHRIDELVLKEMRKERNVALFAIALIALGYILELVFYGFIPVPGLHEEMLRIEEL